MIIADEPTSALDKKNADIVFDLLYKIAHEQNKMVVIATHDPNIYGRADNIFSIEDKKIHSHKAEDFTGTAQNEKKLSIVKLPIGFYFKYLRSNSHRNQLRKRLITLFCALAVSFISFCVDFGQNFVAGQEKLMNQISDREILSFMLPEPKNRDRQNILRTIFRLIQASTTKSEMYWEQIKLFPILKYKEIKLIIKSCFSMSYRIIPIS